MPGAKKPNKYSLASSDYAKRPRQSYLRDTYSNVGLAPYGVRYSGEGVKSTGYFGFIPSPEGGVSTEISREDEYGREYPLLVPTLSREEIDELVHNQGRTFDQRIEDKAYDWAASRRKKGIGPFASPTELRYPMPERVDFGYDTELLRKVLNDVRQAFSK